MANKATYFDKINSPKKKIAKLLGSFDYYSFVFNPLKDDTIVKSSLSDNLTDIYLDLKKSLRNYESNDKAKAQSAIWDFKFDFQSHYGKHIVESLAPIFEILYYSYPYS